MKTECLIMAMDSVLKEKRANTIYVLVNLLTIERDIVKNIFGLLNVLFNNGKDFDHYAIYLANDKEQCELSLSNDYTEKDILTGLKEDKLARSMIHGIVEGMVEGMEEGGARCEKITVKLL